MVRWGALIGCVLGVVGSAWAGQVWLNEDLYYGLDRTDLMVAGRVQQIELDKPKRMNDYGLTFEFVVQRVVWGGYIPEGKTLRFAHRPFIWPVDAVPQDQGTFCILMLRRDGAADPEAHWVQAVVAGSSAPPETLTSREAVRHYLVEQLLGEIQAQTPAARRRALIHQVRPILRADEAAPLVPLAEEKDPWLRRAAIGALTDVTHDPKYAALAAEDLRELQDQAERHAAQYRDYSFLTVYRWKPERPRQPLLPIFRAVAEHEPQTPWDFEHGLVPLCEYATRDDLALLWRYRDSKKAGYDRLALLAISRVLNLGIKTKDIDTDEGAVRERIRAALVKAAVVP